jgi:YidC/Oxa1 family membrane protein insertase
MERRVLLAVILSFIVLYAYQAIFVPPAPRRPAPATAAPPSPANQATVTSPVPVEPMPTPVVALPAVATVTGETGERDIVVDTTTVRAVLTNRGARLKSWQLKQYLGDGGKPVDLVPTSIPADQPLPFSFRVDDGDVTRRINDALYRVNSAGARVDATHAPASVRFDYQDASGLKAHKEFRFEPQNYVVTFSGDVANGEQSLNPVVQLGPGLGDVGAAASGGGFFSPSYRYPPQAVFHQEGKAQRLVASKIADNPVHEGNFRFVGVEDHYFIAAAVNPGRARIEYRALSLPMPGSGTQQRNLLLHTYRFAQAPKEVRFYVGPKSFDVLKSVDPEFVRAIDFGMFAFLAVPLLGALKWIHGFVGNYGWSIIILTVLINLVIFPLRHKSVVSMRRMQELQPQMKAIQDRYADLKVTDPARQKMNTEIMNLYREKGVNPASGCVPMLLTLPVLFAFYALLSQAIELRGASFGLWIRDLSQHDPLYITPILMGATMFWQQKITPSTADPTQQRMMMMMPLMFSFMFLWAPSGLVLYWFVSNLWAIGQQYFTNWLIGPPAIQVVRPPAERRLRSAGAGRTERAEKRS